MHRKHKIATDEFQHFSAVFKWHSKIFKLHTNAQHTNQRTTTTEEVEQKKCVNGERISDGRTRMGQTYACIIKSGKISILH